VPTIEEMNEAILDGAAESYMASVGNASESSAKGEAA
jgi:hypothetical protein